MARQIARETLEKAYDQEKDAGVSRRILLVLKVRCDGVRPSHVAKELRRDKSWVTIWLRRFEEEGLSSRFHAVISRASRSEDIAAQVPH